MTDRRAQERSEKKVSLRREFVHPSFHLAVARSAARSFSLAAGNCLERALRRTIKTKQKNCQLFRKY